MNVLRIVHILTRLLRAGSEENTLLTCIGQLEQGHEVFLLHGHDAAPEHARAKAPALQLLSIPALTREVRPIRDAAAFEQARRMLRRLSPDVVHTHQSKAGIIGRFAAAASGVPLIVHGVHILPFLGERGVNRVMFLSAERAAARATDAFIHVSEGMKNSCLELGVGVDRPHHVVRSGFDLRRFAEAGPPENWREILGLEKGEAKPLVVAMLSSLEPRKNHLNLLAHLPPVLARFPDARVLLAGEGHMRDRIAARIAEMGLQRRVLLLGFRDDPERIIAMSDVCLHCSDREGLPRSVLQYLAAGRPVVLFRLPGIEDVISDGRNGVVVPEGDWTSLMEALAALLADQEARVALARRARRTDLGRWDGALMAKATLEIYRAHARGGPYRRGG